MWQTKHLGEIGGVQTEASTIEFKFRGMFLFIPREVVVFIRNGVSQFTSSITKIREDGRRWPGVWTSQPPALARSLHPTNTTAEI